MAVSVREDVDERGEDVGDGVGEEIGDDIGDESGDNNVCCEDVDAADCCDEDEEPGRRLLSAVTTVDFNDCKALGEGGNFRSFSNSSVARRFSIFAYSTAILAFVDASCLLYTSPSPRD